VAPFGLSEASRSRRSPSPLPLMPDVISTAQRLSRASAPRANPSERRRLNTEGSEPIGGLSDEAAAGIGEKSRKPASEPEPETPALKRLRVPLGTLTFLPLCGVLSSGRYWARSILQIAMKPYSGTAPGPHHTAHIARNVRSSRTTE
jgi:hypothetical protein